MMFALLLSCPHFRLKAYILHLTSYWQAANTKRRRVDDARSLVMVKHLSSSGFVVVEKYKIWKLNIVDQQPVNIISRFIRTASTGSTFKN